MYSRWTSPHVRRLLFLFLNAFFRGCTCLKCTIQARTAPTEQYLRPSCLVGALETSAPPESTVRRPVG